MGGLQGTIQLGIEGRTIAEKRRSQKWPERTEGGLRQSLVTAYETDAATVSVTG
jgi:hypothetical protein